MIYSVSNNDYLPQSLSLYGNVNDERNYVKLVVYNVVCASKIVRG